MWARFGLAINLVVLVVVILLPSMGGAKHTVVGHKAAIALSENEEPVTATEKGELAWDDQAVARVASEASRKWSKEHFSFQKVFVAFFVIFNVFVLFFGLRAPKGTCTFDRHE